MVTFISIILIFLENKKSALLLERLINDIQNALYCCFLGREEVRHSEDKYNCFPSP